MLWSAHIMCRSTTISENTIISWIFMFQVFTGIYRYTPYMYHGYGIYHVYTTYIPSWRFQIQARCPWPSHCDRLTPARPSPGDDGPALAWLRCLGHCLRWLPTLRGGLQTAVVLGRRPGGAAAAHHGQQAHSDESDPSRRPTIQGGVQLFSE
jgi:hypothetical protein